ncbi:DUF732 domain-containing protein [Streptomyces alkaliphilus]|nr:DUF732 domain-containing protein [Streptomyces alkaliphilus]
MRFRSIAAAALLAAALAGCSTSSDAEPAAAETEPAPTPDEQFLAAVDAAGIDSWTEAGPSDTELLAYPEQWCASLAVGHSVDYIFGIHEGMYPVGMDWGTMRADANEVLVLGVTAYCPEYRDEVVQELRETGEY